MNISKSQTNPASSVPTIRVNYELDTKASPVGRTRVLTPDISHFDNLPDAAMISAKELAAVLGQGQSTVWRKTRCESEFPQPVRIGSGCTRFNVGDIRAYLAAKRSSSAKPARAQRMKGQVVARSFMSASHSTALGVSK